MREHEQEQEGQNFEIIQGFVQTVKQESLHPDLLPFEDQKFMQLKELVHEQQQKLKQYLQFEEEDENKPQSKNFRYIIYDTQIQRVQYLMKMYLRIRLKKIQLYCFHFVKNQQEFQRLASPSQIKFLKKYTETRYQHFKDNVFKMFARNYRDFKGVEVSLGKNQNETRQKKIYVQTKQSVIQLNAPNQQQYVFAQILNNPQQFRFGIEWEVSNMQSEHTEVVPLGTIIYGPIKNIKDRLSPKNYRLL